ncbi:MAG: hypothetical protein K0S38_135 [Candidatus Paceibacter sp.]|jgi:hypothetical protein|nr:hypothetical protein [Candidatus Paceibacter sp.]
MLSVFAPWRTWIARQSTLAMFFFGLWVLAFWNNPHVSPQSLFWLKMFCGLGFIAACGNVKVFGIKNHKMHCELLIILSYCIAGFSVAIGLSLSANMLLGLWFGFAITMCLFEWIHDTRQVYQNFRASIHKNTRQVLYGNKSCLGETKYRFVLPPWKTTNQLRLEGLGIALLSFLLWSTFYVLVALWSLKK